MFSSGVALIIALASIALAITTAKSATESQVSPDMVFELQGLVTELVASNQILTNDLALLASSDAETSDSYQALATDLASSNQLLANSLVLLMSGMTPSGGNNGIGDGTPSQGPDLSSAVSEVLFQQMEASQTEMLALRLKVRL
jgi:hypothetical protein